MTGNPDAVVVGAGPNGLVAAVTLALASPALRSLPLEAHGLRWVHPPVALAHVLDHGHAAALRGSPSSVVRDSDRTAVRH